MMLVLERFSEKWTLLVVLATESSLAQGASVAEGKERSLPCKRHRRGRKADRRAGCPEDVAVATCGVSVIAICCCACNNGSAWPCLSAELVASSGHRLLHNGLLDCALDAIFVSCLVCSGTCCAATSWSDGLFGLHGRDGTFWHPGGKSSRSGVKAVTLCWRSSDIDALRSGDATHRPGANFCGDGVSGMGLPFFASEVLTAATDISVAHVDDEADPEECVGVLASASGMASDITAEAGLSSARACVETFRSGVRLSGVICGMGSLASLWRLKAASSLCHSWSIKACLPLTALRRTFRGGSSVKLSLAAKLCGW